LFICGFSGARGDCEGCTCGCEGIDTAPLHLDQIIDEIKLAHDKGQNVSRVHSGDPSVYGAIAEQMRKLDALGIDYDICPGVPAFAAAAAALKTEFTLPEIAQTVIITRTTMKASAMPPGEELEKLGASKATLAIHLSIRNLGYIERALTPHYGADCPVVVAYRVTWPDELFIHGTLSTIAKKVKAAKITRTALILVGEVLGNHDFRDSALYDKSHEHVLRNKKTSKNKS
jgi:precorrin-4/cobalt-precorrin-4 C11-methyltransferase